MSNNVSSTNSTSLYGEAGTNIPSSSTTSFHAPSSSQDVSSTNSTSLYGEAGTPIPDSSGNVVVRGDLLVLSGNILTTLVRLLVAPTLTMHCMLQVLTLATSLLVLLIPILLALQVDL